MLCLFCNGSTRAGTDDICALRFAERAKAPIYIFGSNSKVIRGARLELGQRTGHRQWKGLHLPNFLPVLLRCIAVRVILMKGIKVIAFYSCAGPINFSNTPGEHYTSLTLHQL